MGVGMRGLRIKVADFIGFVNFEFHGQNQVGNIAIRCEEFVENPTKRIRSNLSVIVKDRWFSDY